MTMFEIKDGELAWDYGGSHEFIIKRVPNWHKIFFKEKRREGIPIREVSGKILSDGASLWFEGSVSETIDG